MHRDFVATGLSDMFEAEPVIDLPNLTGQPWLSVKYGEDPDQVYGVVRAEVGDSTVIVKVNPPRGIGETLIPWIIAERGIDLPQPYGSFEASSETSDTARREVAVYALPAVQDVLPRRLGVIEAEGETALVLEDLGEIAYLDASGSIERWPTSRIEKALTAAAGFHAVTAGRDYGWTIRRPRTQTMLTNVPLWRAVLEDAGLRLPDVLPADALSTRLKTLDTLSRWHPAKDVMPACLVHNDFNQRNVGFRETGEVVVLDWELARVNTPQRDVAELLTFTLDAHTEVDELLHLLAVHWQALADNGTDVDPEVYARAAAAEFRVQSFDRVGMQLIFGAAFDLPYLTRINRTVDHLVALTQE